MERSKREYRNSVGGVLLEQGSSVAFSLAYAQEKNVFLVFPQYRTSLQTAILKENGCFA